jgi:hypothetical protein
VIKKMGREMWRQESKGGPLERPRLKCENYIKMNIKEIGWDGFEWINLARDRGDENLDFQRMWVNYWVAEKRSGAVGGICSEELGSV